MSTKLRNIGPKSAAWLRHVLPDAALFRLLLGGARLLRPWLPAPLQGKLPRDTSLASGVLEWHERVKIGHF